MSDNINDPYCSEPECGICTRQDVDVLDGRVHLVNYVGKYVVQTMMAPEIEMPQVGLAMLLAPAGDKRKEFPIYLTLVGFLGDEDASTADSKLLVSGDEFMRFYERHNDDRRVRETHAMIVESVQNGLLDLSTPITELEFHEQSRAIGREYGFLK